MLKAVQGRHLLRQRRRLKGVPHRVCREPLIPLSSFTLTESLSCWWIVARGCLSAVSERKHWTSRQKITRAETPLMWSTSAISFQSNPLRSTRDMVRLS
jgi:hypothetical protein